MGHKRTEHSKITIVSEFSYDVTEELLLEECGLGLDNVDDSFNSDDS